MLSATSDGPFSILLTNEVGEVDVVLVGIFNVILNGLDDVIEVQMQSMTPAERDAISVLGLVAPVTKADVKLRYKILAKMLHPDANGGDKRAEDRLKSVNYAYTTLRDSERLM